MIVLSPFLSPFIHALFLLDRVTMKTVLLPTPSLANSFVTLLPMVIGG